MDHKHETVTDNRITAALVRRCANHPCVLPPAHTNDHMRQDGTRFGGVK